VRRAWGGTLSLLLAGCSGPDDTRAKGCPASPSSFDAIEGAVGIGVVGDAGFELIAEGQALPLVRGFQGGYMLTPTVRADEATFGTDGRCVQMDIAADVASGPAVEQHYRFAALKSDAGYWFSDTVPLFLATNPDELSGKSCTITATWRDDAVESTGAVAVLLSYQGD
jgi:hypothetical protein